LNHRLTQLGHPMNDTSRSEGPLRNSNRDVGTNPERRAPRTTHAPVGKTATEQRKWTPMGNTVQLPVARGESDTQPLEVCRRTVVCRLYRLHRDAARRTYTAVAVQAARVVADAAVPPADGVRESELHAMQQSLRGAAALPRADGRAWDTPGGRVYRCDDAEDAVFLWEPRDGAAPHDRFPRRPVPAGLGAAWAWLRAPRFRCAYDPPRPVGAFLACGGAARGGVVTRRDPVGAAVAEPLAAPGGQSIVLMACDTLIVARRYAVTGGGGDAALASPIDDEPHRSPRAGFLKTLDGFQIFRMMVFRSAYNANHQEIERVLVCTTSHRTGLNVAEIRSCEGFFLNLCEMTCAAHRITRNEPITDTPSGGPRPQARQ
jgi:hypothetical protein